MGANRSGENENENENEDESENEDENEDGGGGAIDQYRIQRATALPLKVADVATAPVSVTVVTEWAGSSVVTRSQALLGPSGGAGRKPTRTGRASPGAMAVSVLGWTSKPN